MLIDYTQGQENVTVSYVNAQRQIAVEELNLSELNIAGFKPDEKYYSYVECYDHDPNKLEALTSFMGSAIKRLPAKYFTHHNVNEFLNVDVPNKYPDAAEKFSLLNEPNPFSFDIETDITDETGYSTAAKAENHVLSISVTDFEMNSILMVVKNPKHPKISVVDRGEIDAILQEALKHYYTKYPYNYDILVFDDEKAMLNAFIEAIHSYLHLLIGWNCLSFDWQYIYNRCVALNINVKKASPKNRLSSRRVEIKPDVHIELKIPTHRIITDYMMLFKDSLTYNNLGSYSLNNVSELVLDLNKVEYDGNLRTLYEEYYLKFLGYALIDTILVMLLHKATNLLTVDFFQSYYTGVPYLKLSQNSISEALIYQELRNDNIFLLESEKTTSPARKYEGGYVKAPTKKIVDACAGEDFGGLYPNGMITMGLSPEAKIDIIEVDKETGFPTKPDAMTKWAKYKKLGYSLSPRGRIYDMSKDFLFTRVEKKLLAQRKIFKGHMEDIYMILVPKIEEEIERKKQLQANNL